jgi:rhamnopyranosyl-N-acetylglucosaminyl-diphospho-decaprenol beta-1,3/1,4-galactofuranosyltransferase
MAKRVAAIVVTFNRYDLLKACLEQLLQQSTPPDRIIVIDNASTDCTAQLLRENYSNPQISYIRLPENIGGAGGFAFGIDAAMKQGFDWYWLMDDDASPEPAALELLLKETRNETDIYASSAIAQHEKQTALCWPVTRSRPDQACRNIHAYDDLGQVESVQGAPFLGLLIHRKLVEQIGLPASEFFISGDDMEYCARARTHGARIFQVKSSVIRHPMPDRKIISFAGHSFAILVLSPWKRYYDVRNRILIARRYYGIRLLTQTLPGLLLRLTISLIEDRSLQQLKAYSLGIIDGLLGRTGKRWMPPSDANTKQSRGRCA